MIFLLLFLSLSKAFASEWLEPPQFLHKTPSEVLERMFSSRGGSREIPLEFNMDSREERHNDMKNVYPEVRSEDFGTISLVDLRKQQESSRYVRSTGPSFDLPVYDFMVPAGNQTNSSLLAILKFSTSEARPVKFNIVMDRLKWFEITEVKRKQNGDKFDYEIPVLLRAGADVRPELTKNSVYKFNVEAVQGGQTTTSRVRVEVLAFSPTTQRARTTTETTLQKGGEGNEIKNQQIEIGKQEFEQESVELNTHRTVGEAINTSTNTPEMHDEFTVTEKSEEFKNEKTIVQDPKIEESASINDQNFHSRNSNKPVEFIKGERIFAKSSTVTNNERTISDQEFIKPSVKQQNLEDINSKVIIISSENERKPEIKEKLNEIQLKKLPSAVQKPLTISEKFEESDFKTLVKSSEVLKEAHQREEKFVEQILPTDQSTSHGSIDSLKHQNPKSTLPSPEVHLLSPIVSHTPETTTVESLVSSLNVEGSADDLILSADPKTTPPSSTVPSKNLNFMDQATMADDQLLTTKVPKKMESVEGSGKSGEDQEEEDPLSEFITDATPIVQKISSSLSLDVSGTENGIFTINGFLNRGNLLRGLVITPRNPSKSFLSLSTDRPEIFSIRPRRLEAGGNAYLFLNHPNFYGDIQLKIVVRDDEADEEEEETIVIRRNKLMEEEKSQKIDFNISEDAPTGTVIGHIEGGESMKVVGKTGLFALMGADIVLLCPSEAPCLDYESQHIYYLLLIAKDGSGKTTKVAIQILDVNDNTPQIETTDGVLRVSDGKMIMPFAVQIVDEDTPSVQTNILTTSGDASDFVVLERVDVDLYQVGIKGSPNPGRYELSLQVDDGIHRSRKTRKTIRVLVQNSHAHAHFRRGSYDRNVTPDKIHEGIEVTRLELEGLPIDEARFVILSGNPGWISVDDYGGTVHFTRPHRSPLPGRYDITVVALGRETGRILAKTMVSVTVLGTSNVKKVFEKTVYEKTIDRESAEPLEFDLNIDSPTTIDFSSVLAIDESGLKKELDQRFIILKGDVINLSKQAVSSLRVVQFTIKSGQETATVLIHLISSPQFLEHIRKMASKPLFPVLPELLEVMEELPVGHVLTTIPAVNPMTGEIVPVRMEEGEGVFSLEKETGVLKIAKSLDFDSSSTSKVFNLKFTAGEAGYESVISMKIALLDKDDNAPSLAKESIPGKIVIPENLPVDSVILKIPVSDVDEISKKGLKIAISEPSSAFFKAQILNSTAILQVAKELDREVTPFHVFQLILSDSAGHKDAATIIVALSDINDNAPKFTKDIYEVQAVENWPAGLVLETIQAIDRDTNERGEVKYQLETKNSKYFSLNSTTGELFISQDLMGLAREEPYHLQAIANDPLHNSTVPIQITIAEPRKKNLTQLVFISPPLDYILELKGNKLEPNEKVYQAKAKVNGDGRNIKYFVKELFADNSSFNIDEMTGELMISKRFERKGEHILVLSARHFHSGVKASRLLRVSFTPTNRPMPFFAEGSPLYFSFHHFKSLGVLYAAVEDNGPIFYYLIPSCSPNTDLFALNSSSGELSHIGPEAPKAARVELCVLATNEKLEESANLTFDDMKRNNVRIAIVTEHEEEPLPDLSSINNTVVTLDRKLSRAHILVDEDRLKHYYNFSVGSVVFLPSETTPPLATMAPIASLFSVGPRGIVRPSPSLSLQPSGVYIVNVESKDQNGRVEEAKQEFHLVQETARLRFIFDRQVVLLAKEFHAFEKELSSLLSKSSFDSLRLVLDPPHPLRANVSRSTACFHTVRKDSLLSPPTTLTTFQKISDLFEVYNKFGVVDIVANCEEPPVVENPMAMALASSSSLFILSILALAILFFFLVFVYFCFIRRYRDYLRAKEKAMKGHPQLIVPSTPTFVLTPPINPPAAIGYWE